MMKNTQNNVVVVVAPHVSARQISLIEWKKNMYTNDTLFQYIEPMVFYYSPSYLYRGQLSL